jgi:hypothetical protein
MDATKRDQWTRADFVDYLITLFFRNGLFSIHTLRKLIWNWERSCEFRSLRMFTLTHVVSLTPESLEIRVGPVLISLSKISFRSSLFLMTIATMTKAFFSIVFPVFSGWFHWTFLLLLAWRVRLLLFWRPPSPENLGNKKNPTKNQPKFKTYFDSPELFTSPPAFFSRLSCYVSPETSFENVAGTSILSAKVYLKKFAFVIVAKTNQIELKFSIAKSFARYSANSAKSKPDRLFL